MSAEVIPYFLGFKEFLDLCHDDAHLLDLARLDLGVRVVDPVHEDLHVLGLHIGAAPDAQAGGRVAVGPDVEGDLVALEEGRHRLHLVLGEVLDDEAAAGVGDGGGVLGEEGHLPFCHE